MSAKPTIAYKTLRVHGAAAPTTPCDAAPRPDPARPRFSDLMKRRPVETPVALPPRRDEAAPIDDEVDALVVPADIDRPPTEASAAEPPSPDRVAAMRTVEEVKAVEGVQAPAVTPIGDPLDPRLVDYIAATVTRFCNDSAVRDGDGWQVRIALRPDVLPATTLHLSLSPHWLLLRFESSDERSRHLLSSHRETLEASLDAALVPRRGVSITCD
jgi:type III secretion control protein HpaP